MPTKMSQSPQVIVEETFSENEEYQQVANQLESDASDEDIASSDSSENLEQHGDNYSGWVDSIAKILKSNKPKRKKTLVLSKAKKLTDPLIKVNIQPQTKSAGYQIAAADGTIKEEKIVNVATATESTGTSKKSKRNILSVRVRPNVLEKDRERLLAKIATKGVVQLFNAVKQQQREIDIKLEKAGPLEGNRDKVLKCVDKRTFLDNLMGEKAKCVDVEQKLPIKCSNVERGTTWNVFQDDFMMGSNKIKDWDKQIEAEETNEMEIVSELY